jgi:hypothetical protein
MSGSCEKCGALRNPKGGCPNEMQHVGEWAEEMQNAYLLFRDDLLYGTIFVDVTGKRIDPRSISPTIRDYAQPWEDIIDRGEKPSD